ncbi:MAG TPA: hypothetical protein DFR83_07540, partial [Deltaproteobacteria bacterium]|nr:hypothetical protein [Deltaproteobacteria bacterium]
ADSSLASEVRFYCDTSYHSRVIHFKTSQAAIIQMAFDGTSAASVSDWQSFTALSGHTGNLPAATNLVQQLTGAVVQTGFTGAPFYVDGGSGWSIRLNGFRWECDDFNAGYNQDTLHQVWFR